MRQWKHAWLNSYLLQACSGLPRALMRLRDVRCGALANWPTTALRAYDPGHDLPATASSLWCCHCRAGFQRKPAWPEPIALARCPPCLKSSGVIRIRSALAQECALPGGSSDRSRITLGNGSHEFLVLMAQCFADSAASNRVCAIRFRGLCDRSGEHPVRRRFAVPALPRHHAERLSDTISRPCLSRPQ